MYYYIENHEEDQVLQVVVTKSQNNKHKIEIILYSKS